jgi:hypothetical protein
MTTGRWAAVIIVGLAVSFAGAAWTVRQRHDADGRRAVVMRAVAESIGMNSLALSSEGAAPRHPTEGPAGCLGNTPAGYCVRGICDVVTCPFLNDQPAFELVRADR